MDTDTMYMDVYMFKCSVEQIQSGECEMTAWVRVRTRVSGQVSPKSRSKLNQEIKNQSKLNQDIKIGQS